MSVLRRGARACLVLAILVMSGMLTGCMIVRGGTLQPPETWPPASMPVQKTITLTITSKAPDGMKTNVKLLQLLEGQSQKAYMESGLFSQTMLSKSPADLHATVQYVEEGSRGLASLSGFLCGFTLGMVPGYVKGNIITITTFEDQTGKVLGTIRQSETHSFWMQLFLVAVMPFREEPQAIAREIYYDLNRVTLEQARSQGIL